MAGDGMEGCPCTVSCINHGDCASCRQAHEAAGTKTACEKLGLPSVAERNSRAVANSVKLLDFSPCAG